MNKKTPVRTRSASAALCVARMPPEDLGYIADLFQRAAAGAFEPATAQKYMIYLQRAAYAFNQMPELLERPLAERLAAPALAIYVNNMRERGFSEARIRLALQNLNYAVHAAAPTIDRSGLQEVIRQIENEKSEGVDASSSEPLLMPLERMIALYPELFRKLTGTLDVASKRRVETLSDSTRDIYERRLASYLSALERSAKDLPDANALFGKHAIVTFVRDVLQRSPVSAGSRIEGIKVVATRLMPEVDHSWMRQLINSLNFAFNPESNALEKRKLARNPPLIQQDVEFLEKWIEDDFGSRMEGRKGLKTSSRKDFFSSMRSFMGALSRVAPSLRERSIVERIVPATVCLVIPELAKTNNAWKIAEHLRVLKRLLDRAYGPNFGWLSDMARDVVVKRDKSRDRRPADDVRGVDVADLLREAFSTMNASLARIVAIGDSPVPFSLAPIAEAYRDGLTVAFLALMGPRVDIAASARVRTEDVAKNFRGVALIRKEFGYIWVVGDPKNSLPDLKRVPDLLAVFIDIFREFLIKIIYPGAPSDILWPSRRSRALTKSGMQKRIPEVTNAMCGVPITAHGHRYVIAGAAGQMVEVDVELASKILQHVTPAETQATYMPTSCEAGTEFLATLVGKAIAAALPLEDEMNSDA